MSDETLTPREVAMLTAWSHGATTEETAAELHFAKQTLENAGYRLRHKLHARNKTEAVAIALTRGLIEYAERQI